MGKGTCLHVADWNFILHNAGCAPKSKKITPKFSLSVHSSQLFLYPGRHHCLYSSVSRSHKVSEFLHFLCLLIIVSVHTASTLSPMLYGARQSLPVLMPEPVAVIQDFLLCLERSSPFFWKLWLYRALGSLEGAQKHERKLWGIRTFNILFYFCY